MRNAEPPRVTRVGAAARPRSVEYGPRRFRAGSVVVAATAGLALCLGPLVGALGAASASGAATAGPLGLAIASFSGDSAVTPSVSALATSDLTYQVTVTNATASTQSNVSVPVSVPSNFVLQSGSLSASSGTAAVSAGVITWSIPTLAAGDSATVTYTETTDAPTALESDATSASATSDQSTTPVTASASVEVLPAADLSVSVTDGTSTIEPGATDTYTISVTNNGPSETPNVTVTETFSDEFDAIAESDTAAATFTDLGGSQFQWSGIDLASGASANLELTGTVSSSLAPGSAFVSLANASLFPGAIDTNPVAYGVDADSVAGAATAGPLGLAIASFSGDSAVTPSVSALATSDLTYQVTVTNATASTQSNVSVPVSVPSNFVLQSGSLSASSGTAAVSAGVITWSIPTLAAGDSATVTYTETTDAPTALESDATSVSATSDQSTTPVTASASVEVLPAADLSVSVTDGTSTIEPGATDTYTISVTNNGPSEVTNATLSDSVSDGFTPFFAVSSVGGTSFADIGPDQFQWSGISLASGQSAMFSILGVTSTSLTAGSPYIDLVNVSTSAAQVDADASANAVDADVVIPVPQAISFTPPVVGIVGEPATLVATGGGSGDPVVFSVDPASDAGVCAVSGVDGTTLTYEQAGTCIVDADQAGDAGYAAAPTVTASIEVEQAPAFTEDAPPLTVIAGQPYTASFGASGLPVPTFALASGAPSWLSLDSSTGALAGTPPTGTASFSYSVVATNAIGSATAGPFCVTVTTPTPSHPFDADVSASLSCPSSVPAHHQGSCTLTVANAGPAPARFLTAEIVLPEGLARLPASRGGAWFGGAGLWSDRALAPGSSASFSVDFVAFRPTWGPVLGAAFSFTHDPNVANNVATARVDVTGWSPGGEIRAGRSPQRQGRGSGHRCCTWTSGHG